MKRIACYVALVILLACASCGGGKLTKDEASKALRAQWDGVSAGGATAHFNEVTGITHNDTGSEATVTYTVFVDVGNQGNATLQKVAKFRKFDDGSWRIIGDRF